MVINLSAGGDGAVQALVEEQIRPRRYVLPRRERAGLLAVRRGFFLVVEVLADLGGALFAVDAKERLQLLEEIPVGSEVAQDLPVLLRFRERLAHRSTIVAVECVALDDDGLDALAAEDLLEDRLDGRRSSTGRAGDGDDWVLGRHQSIAL